MNHISLTLKFMVPTVHVRTKGSYADYYEDCSFVQKNLKSKEHTI